MKSLSVAKACEALLVEVLLLVNPKKAFNSLNHISVLCHTSGEIST